MAPPLIHFIHGKESGPWGSKITYLANLVREMGFDVESLDYSSTHDPHKRITMLAEAHTQRATSYLVGSSMGGWVALSATAKISVKGIFLLAPALDIDGYPPYEVGIDGNAIEIIHGWHDSLIPWQNAVNFSHKHKCSIHLVDDDHRLQNRLWQVGEYLAGFLKRMEKSK